MSELVERILLAAREKENWLVVLEKELNELDSGSVMMLLEQVLTGLIKENFPLSVVKDLLDFSDTKILDLNLLSLQIASAYGNEEVFGLAMETASGPIVPEVVYEGAAEQGKERLLQVLSWLEELTDNYEMFDSYLHQIEYYHQELTGIQKLVIVEGSKSLHIDPFTYEWGKGGGIVRNWLTSMANDV